MEYGWFKNTYIIIDTVKIEAFQQQIDTFYAST